MKDPIPEGYFNRGGEVSMDDPIPAGYFQVGGQVGFRARPQEGQFANLGAEQGSLRRPLTGGGSNTVGTDQHPAFVYQQNPVPTPTTAPPAPSTGGSDGEESFVAPPQAEPEFQSLGSNLIGHTDAQGNWYAPEGFSPSIETGGWTTGDGQFLGSGTSFLEDDNWETTQAGIDFSSNTGAAFDPRQFSSSYGSAPGGQTGGGLGGLISSYANLGPQIPLPGGGSFGLLPGQGLAALASRAFDLDEHQTTAGRQAREAGEVRAGELGGDWGYDFETGQFTHGDFRGTEGDVQTDIDNTALAAGVEGIGYDHTTDQFSYNDWTGGGFQEAQEFRTDDLNAQEAARTPGISYDQRSNTFTDRYGNTYSDAAAASTGQQVHAEDLAAQHSSGAGDHSGYGGHSYSINTGGSDESFQSNSNWETTSGGVDYSANTGSNWDPNQFTSNYGGDSGGGDSGGGGK